MSSTENFGNMESAPSACPPALRERLHQWALVYIRQSSMQQVIRNVGSTLMQKDLEQLARSWGFDKVKVIDDDLGHSAAVAGHRRGFDSLIETMNAGNVAVVLYADPSRLARNLLEAEQFLDAAERNAVFIWTDNRLYDPANDDFVELLGLRINNLFAFIEHRRIRARLEGGKKRKLEGDTPVPVTPPPWGFVKRPGDPTEWDLDDDRKVREPFELLWALARQKPSATAAFKELDKRGTLFPIRHRRGGGIIFERMKFSRLVSILRNPNYTQHYVYGLYKIITVGGRRRQVRRPPSEWQKIPDHHPPGYISWDDFLEIQRKLDGNQPRWRNEAARVQTGNGDALLQNLLICPRGRQVKTKYNHRTKDASGAERWGGTYNCYHFVEPGDGRSTSCFQIRVDLLDAGVTALVLRALTGPDLPAAIEEIADQARLRERTQRGLVVQRRHLQEREARLKAVLEDAKAEGTHRVQRDYVNELEQVKRRLEEIEDTLQHPPDGPPPLGRDEADQVVHVAASAEALWAASTTTNRDRRELLELVLSRVRVLRVTDETLEVEVRWATDAVDHLTVRRPFGLSAAVVRLHRAGHSNAEIVGILAGQGIQTQTGRAVRASDVARILGSHLGTRRERESASLAEIHRLTLEGWTGQAIAEHLQATGYRHWLGTWTAVRVYHAQRRLRRGQVPPGVPTLPPVRRSLRCIARDLARDLRARRLDPGELVRRLADEAEACGKPPVTVRNALQHLRAEGLLTADEHRLCLRSWRQLHPPRRSRPQETSPEAVALMAERRRAGAPWSAIAVDLNAASFRTARGKPFTAECAQQVLRHRGFRLSRPLKHPQAPRELEAFFRRRGIASRREYLAEFRGCFSELLLDPARKALVAAGRLRPLQTAKGLHAVWQYVPPGSQPEAECSVPERYRQPGLPPRKRQPAREALVMFFLDRQAATRDQYVRHFEGQLSSRLLDAARRELEAIGSLRAPARRGQPWRLVDNGAGAGLPAPETCRRLRKRAGLSREEFARDVGVHPQTITHYELGVKTPGPTLLPKYLAALCRCVGVAGLPDGSR